MQKHVPNELHSELLGVLSLNPFVAHNSSPRGQMMSSHISQILVVKGSTERRIQTGMEREYGKYTFSIKTPGEHGDRGGIEIIKIIERYPYKIGMDAIKLNPQTIVLFEDVETKEVGMLSIPKYCSYHQYFGFEYTPTPALNDIRIGAFIPAGTVLMDTPSKTKDGGYKYGVECNVAYMSHPAVSEDGILISRDVLKKFAFKTYETRVVEWGNKKFPLNLYGTIDTYKPFPDIGDKIRDDGLLMCLRNYDKDLSVVEQSIYDLMEPDFIFDKLTYAGGPGGVVVDIRIHHDSRNTPVNFNTTMDDQADKYNVARYAFYREILNEYHRLRRARGDNLRITPELHRMVVEALGVLDSEQQRLTKLYRNTPLDDYRVEFVVEYEIEPMIGYKLSDLHGGKGIICAIAEPYEMPVDENGNRADIVMDAFSTISRMNIGRLYEQYINSAARDVQKTICHNLNINESNYDILIKLIEMEKNESDILNRVWDYLIDFYRIVSPKMYLVFTDGEYKGTRIQHLASIIKNGIYLYMPPDNEPENDEIVKQLEKFFKPTYGPVSYIGTSGVKVTTTSPVRIGSVYIVLLEKTGDDWTAVSSGKLQHFGVLSQVTNNDKFSQPSRNQAIRALGESEVRIMVSYTSPKLIADVMDRNNNPICHKAILESILSSNIPTNIDSAVNRVHIPIGSNKPQLLVRHMTMCSGWEFMYTQHVPSWK